MKIFWPDYTHYTVDELKTTENDPGRKHLEASWTEKRFLLDKASSPLPSDLYFALYNNTWNCNQPMWAEGNAQYRFRFRSR